MTLKYTTDAAEAAFIKDVRAFVSTHLPPDMATRNMTAVHWTREDMLGWTGILHQKGWSTVHWPEAYGGPGWTARQRHLFEDIVFAEGAPPLNMQAITLVGPVIYTFGTEAQKQKFLPDIAAGKVFWAQGFSEPNAGSDLASLKTTALLDGDSYVINGQKIWTSQAHFADWLFLLVRTDPTADKRAGISFILCPANAPGVTIRPITSIDGGISLCEVFLENVRVPAENLVGEAGKGWTYANFLLANERTTTAEIPRNRRMLARLKDLATSHKRNGRPLIHDPVFATKITQLELELHALEVSVQRVLAETVPAQYPMASTLKLRGSEILQGILELQVETLGNRAAIAMHEDLDALSQLEGLTDGVEVTEEYLFRRAATIYGGASEIQRGIIGKTVLRIDPRASLSHPLHEDQIMLADSLTRLTEQRYNFIDRARLLSRGGAAVRENWTALAEIGLTAMALSEEAGGLESPLADLAIASEALGGALATEPFLFGSVLAAKLIETTDGAQSQWLDGVAEGDRILAIAHEDLDSAPCILRHTAEGYSLSGKKAMVIGAGVADVLVVIAATENGASCLMALPSDTVGIKTQDYTLYDGRQASDILFENVMLDDRNILPTEDAEVSLAHSLAIGKVLLCAESVGAMEKALWITRDYVQTRRQFNAALADFQAVQHRLADMYVELEQARSFLMRSVALFDADPAVSIACKAIVGASARKLAAAAIQLHGGIGMTEECAIGHYFKRIMVNDLLLGTATDNLKALSEVS